MRRLTDNYKALIAGALLIVAALALGGCGEKALVRNPMEIATTPAERVYAISAQYTLTLEQLAVFVETPGLDRSIVEAVQKAEAEASPVIDSMEEALHTYLLLQAQADLDPTETRLQAARSALAALENWIRKANEANDGLAVEVTTP